MWSKIARFVCACSPVGDKCQQRCGGSTQNRVACLPQTKSFVQTRFVFIREVVDAWQWEAQQIADPAVNWPHHYAYATQPFTVKLKDFWPLHKLPFVLKNVVPALQHENDGFILQVLLFPATAAQLR